METRFLCKSALVCMLIGCMSLGMVSCSDDDDNNNRPTPKTDKSTLEYLTSDYLAAVNQYPEFIGHFMEAQYELTGKVSELDLNELKPTYGTMSTEYRILLTPKSMVVCPICLSKTATSLQERRQNW